MADYDPVDYCVYSTSELSTHFKTLAVLIRGSDDDKNLFYRTIGDKYNTIMHRQYGALMASTTCMYVSGLLKESDFHSVPTRTLCVLVFHSLKLGLPYTDELVRVGKDRFSPFELEMIRQFQAGFL